MLIICLILADDTSTFSQSSSITARTVRYLGKIVFSLYLVHSSLMRSGLRMMPHKVWVAMGLGFPAKLEHMGAFSHMVGIAVLLLLLWAADMFFREVEERTRRVMYWIQGMCFTKKS